MTAENSMLYNAITLFCALFTIEYWTVLQVILEVETVFLSVLFLLEKPEKSPFAPQYIVICHMCVCTCLHVLIYDYCK